MLIVNRETVGQTTTTVGVACDVCGLRVEDPGRDATSAGYGTLPVSIISSAFAISPAE